MTKEEQYEVFRKDFFNNEDKLGQIFNEIFELYERYKDLQSRITELENKYETNNA